MYKSVFSRDRFAPFAHRSSQERGGTLGLEIIRAGYVFEVWDTKLIELGLGTRSAHANTSINNLVVMAKGFDVNRPTRFLMAHYDVMNMQSENANDNTAGLLVILQYLKDRTFPEHCNIVAVFTDAEEKGALGAYFLSQSIKEGRFGDVEFVLNLDVVARGHTVVTENAPSALGQRLEHLGVRRIFIPYNDSYPLRAEHIDSVVLCSGHAWGDLDPWLTIHTDKDTYDSLDIPSMDNVYQLVHEVMKA